VGLCAQRPLLGQRRISEERGALAAFAFQELGVYRLEARVVDANGRANGALHKFGATCEGVLRGGFRDGTTIQHQRMWSILASEWSADGSRTRERR
jgi:ribosomal-protein-alanine N-acetyltransferase